MFFLIIIIFTSIFFKNLLLFIVLFVCCPACFTYCPVCSIYVSHYCICMLLLCCIVVLKRLLFWLRSFLCRNNIKSRLSCLDLGPVCWRVCRCSGHAPLPKPSLCALGCWSTLPRLDSRRSRPALTPSLTSWETRTSNCPMGERSHCCLTLPLKVWTGFSLSNKLDH